MKSILLLSLSLLAPTVSARSILKKKTPILIYKSTAKKNGFKQLDSNLYERVLVANSAQLSSDRYGITLMNKEDKASRVQFEYLLDTTKELSYMHLDYNLKCTGKCLIETRVRCESKNQDRPKVTKIVSLELNNEEKILSSKKLKLAPSSCTKGLYFIENYTLLDYTSRLQIRSIKPIVKPLILSKSSATKKTRL